MILILSGLSGCASGPAVDKSSRSVAHVESSLPSPAAGATPICYQPVCCNDSTALQFEAHRLNCQSIAEKKQGKTSESLTSLNAAIQAAQQAQSTQKEASNEVLCYALNDAGHRANATDNSHNSKSSNLQSDKKSLGYFIDSYKACKTRFGENSDAAAQSLYSIANHHLANNRFAEAKPMMQQAQELSKANGNKGLESFATDALGRIADMEGDFANGKNLLRQAIELKKLVFGERSSEMAVSFTNMGASYIESKDGATGREWYRRAVSIYSDLFGEADDRTLSVAAALATSHLYDGELVKADSQYAQLVPKFTQTYGATVERTVSLINDWGAVLTRQERYPEALIKFEQALQIRRKTVPNSLLHGFTALNTAKIQKILSSCDDKKTIALRLESNEIGLKLLQTKLTSRLQYEEAKEFSDDIQAFNQDCINAPTSLKRTK